MMLRPAYRDGSAQHARRRYRLAPEVSRHRAHQFPI
jgi:hypothetical protein